MIQRAVCIAKANGFERLSLRKTVFSSMYFSDKIRRSSSMKREKQRFTKITLKQTNKQTNRLHKSYFLITETEHLSLAFAFSPATLLTRKIIFLHRSNGSDDNDDRVLEEDPRRRCSKQVRSSGLLVRSHEIDAFSTTDDPETLASRHRTDTCPTSRDKTS
jgi:hypothetical protein